jgi:hypothetical protein
MFTGPVVERGDGLILYLDATNPKSYPGSGSTWFDLSGKNNHMTNNGSTTTTTFGGTTAFNFDANGKFFSGTLSGVMPSTNATLEVWIYPGASEVQADDRGCIILLSGTSGIYMSWNKSNQKLSNYWYDHSPEGYHETTSASSRGTWSHWCSVWNYSEGKINQWVNGTKTTANTIGTSSSGSSLLIGREGSSRQFSGGLAVVKIYNNALSDDKVLQNFNALRGRFRI